MTKLDVLDELKEIKVAISYKLDGKEFTDAPPGQSSLASGYLNNFPFSQFL